MLTMSALRYLRPRPIITSFINVAKLPKTAARTNLSLCRQFSQKEDSFRNYPAVTKNLSIQDHVSFSNKADNAPNTEKNGYSSSGNSESNDQDDEVPPGELMNFEKRMFPSPWLYVKNFMCENLIIKAHFDQEFSLASFKEGAKQALVSVSRDLSTGNLTSLAGRVTPEAVEVLQKSFSKLSLGQRTRLRVNPEDISLAFPHQLGIIMEGDSGNMRTFAEITMCFHLVKNFEKLIQQNMDNASFDTASALRDGLSFANYRFIREITKGVQDEWKINVINHFSPIDDAQN